MTHAFIKSYLFLCSMNQMYYELILITFVLYFIVMIVYIKTKYPFWSLQPVFHKYDFWRHIYQKHFIIVKNVRLLSRYYQSMIKTFKYENFDSLDEYVHFIHCHYIESDKVIMKADRNYFDSYFTGLNKSSFISIFEDKSTIIASITSRSLHLFHNNFDNDLYYLDMICIKRGTKKSDHVFLNLFHTHIINQTNMDSSVKSFIFKKDIELIEESVPLVKFTTFLFYTNKQLIIFIKKAN